MSSLRQMLKSSSIYGSADGISKAVALLLIPLYTHFLAVSDYGRLALYQSLAGVLSTTLLWGTTASIASFYHFREYRDRFEQVKESTVRFLLAVNLVVVALLYLGSRVLGTNPVLTALVLAIAYLAVVRSIQSVHYIHSGRPGKQFALVVSFSIASAVAIVLALVLFPHPSPVTRIFFSLVLTGAIFFVVVAAGNGFYVTGHFQWPLVREVLAFGIPVLPHALSQWTLNFADRAMLRYFLDYEQVGIYSLGYNFGMVMFMFLGAINTSWAPAFLRTAENEENAPEILGRIASNIWKGFCLGAAGYLLWIHEVVVVATPRNYHDAIVLSKWIVLGYLVYGSYLLYANGLFAARKTRLVPVATMTAAAVNVALNLVLIPRFGPSGAVAATLASFTVMACLVYVLAMRHYPIPLGLRKLIAPGTVPLGAFGVSMLVDGVPVWFVRVGLKGALTAPLVLYAYARFRGKNGTT
ncbi:MAG: polysaccharide biosynthesis C-terminal domain-containing protein [bacterium]|nr:MAG: polysaccharide biosynthesis C-terminal domain-containing protein [bacterium]